MDVGKKLKPTKDRKEKTMNENIPQPKIRSVHSLSSLIFLGLKNMQTCKIDDAYDIDMDSWIENDADDVCLVCLAGSVFVQSFGVKSEIKQMIDNRINHSMQPGDVENLVSNQDELMVQKVKSLNDIRNNKIFLAAKRFYGYDYQIDGVRIDSFKIIQEELFEASFPLMPHEYRGNEAKFEDCLLSIANILKSKGM